MLTDKLSFLYRLSLLLKHIKCTLNLGLKTLLNRFFLWAPSRREDSDKYLQDKFVAWSFDSNFFLTLQLSPFHLYISSMHFKLTGEENLPQFYHASSVSWRAPTWKWQMANWPIRARTLLLLCYKKLWVRISFQIGDSPSAVLLYLCVNFHKKNVGVAF